MRRRVQLINSNWHPIEQDFPYTKAVQSITAPKGVYKLQCWGAQGGGTTGGKGGYSEGIITLSSPTTLYIYVGGTTSSETGGYNGGSVAISSAKYTGWGGGGASDIRIGTDSLYARVIVAGGGGGDGDYSETVTKYGGYGGGTTGGYGARGSSNYKAGEGGSQTQGGTCYNGTGSTGSGSFGSGANGGSAAPGGAGGGGWYGGGGARRAGGGGGSGYVYYAGTASNYPSGCLLNSEYYLADTVIRDGNTSFPSTNGGTETGHEGNGFVRITRLQNL